MNSFKALFFGISDMHDYHASRRTFLRAAGVGLALPLLESRGLRADVAQQTDSPRRLVAMNFALGLHGPNFFPEQSGGDYVQTPYLEALGADLRDRLTILSGTSHPDVTLGHASDSTFLTAARFPGAATFRNSISLDQFLVEKLRPETRFPSMALGTRSGTISFSRSGVMIPPETKPSVVFTKMFVNGTKSQVAKQVQRLEEGRSVLDAVLSPAKQLQARVSTPTASDWTNTSPLSVISSFGSLVMKNGRPDPNLKSITLHRRMRPIRTTILLV